MFTKNNRKIGFHVGEQLANLFFNLPPDLLIAPRKEFDKTSNNGFSFVVIDSEKCLTTLEYNETTYKMLSGYADEIPKADNKKYFTDTFTVEGNGRRFTVYINSLLIEYYNNEKKIYLNKKKILYEAVHKAHYDTEYILFIDGQRYKILFNNDYNQPYILDSTDIISNSYDFSINTNIKITFNALNIDENKIYKFTSQHSPVKSDGDPDETYVKDVKEINVFTEDEFASRKFDSISNVINRNNVTQLLISAGFYMILMLRESNNWHDTVETDTYNKSMNFINRFALCILKLSTINAFCTSYSLDLLSLPDTTKRFYNIYESYLSDFINIKQEIKN